MFTLNTSGKGGVNTFKYNAYWHISTLPIQGATTSSSELWYNYAEGYVYNGLQGHGEFYADTGQGAKAHTWYYFNTILQPNNVASSTTTGIWVSDGSHTLNTTYQDAEVLNNTIVMNCLVGNSAPCPRAARVAGELVTFDGTQTASLIENNFLDFTGAFYVLWVSATCTNKIVSSGNRDLVSGSDVSTNWHDARQVGCI
jgi:hypothetical protein